VDVHAKSLEKKVSESELKLIGFSNNKMYGIVFSIFKGTVSQDWEGLLMVEKDRTTFLLLREHVYFKIWPHFWNKNDKKMWRAGSS